MNKSRLIWGIICLALAGLLGVLYFALPPDKLMFMVGDRNMPYRPPIILGIVSGHAGRFHISAWRSISDMLVVDRGRYNHGGLECRSLFLRDQDERIHDIRGDSCHN